MADFSETTYPDLEMFKIMLWPKKLLTITWRNGHQDYQRIYVSPDLSEWIHLSLVTHICQWIRQRVAYFTKEVNPGLAKPPLKFNGC